MPSSKVIPFDHAAALKRCSQGDSNALYQIYQQEAPKLLGVVVRIVKDRGMAEDIVHDVYLTVWQRAGDYDPAKGSARVWLYSIARHKALNAIRQIGRIDYRDLQEISDTGSEAAFQDVGYDDQLFDRQVGQRMDECMKQLGAEQRNCILHAYVDGLSHSEISAYTGMPLGTIKSWVKRSLQQLRECMA